MADYDYLQQRINRFQTSVTDYVNRALGTAPVPRRTIPERWPAPITSPVQNDKLETNAPARQAPNAAASAVTLPPAPAQSSAKTGVATRSSTPAKRAAAPTKDANPTTEFVRSHQAKLAGEMSAQTRDKLANALRNEPAFARYKDMMAGAANNAAIARGVNWNVGTSAERATIGRNFATLVRLAAGAN